MIETTAYPLLAEHARGDSYRVLGQRYGMSHESARQIVLRTGTKFANQVEMDLMLAWKSERMGREAVWPTLVVPFQDQADYQTALSLSSCRTSAPVGSLNLGSIMSREDWIQRYAGRVADEDFRAPFMAADRSVPETSTSRLASFYGAIPRVRRRLTLLDHIPTSTMDGAAFPYTKESGSFATAAETAELATKPTADVALTDAEVHARTVAHFLKCARQQLADVPGLANLLNSRLIYGVNLRLEGQILSGSGTGENILGVLNTSGIGAPASGGGDSVNADLILNGITAVPNSGAVPTAVVLNPHGPGADAEGQGLGLGCPARLQRRVLGGHRDSVWSVPSIANLGMPAGLALVGDFFLGATLFVREGVNVRTSDSDQDDFVKNRVTMLGEGRFGLAVWNAACFANV